MILSIPKHIAIIPDGNRRWAKQHNLPSIEGHRRGADLVMDLGKKAKELGVKVLTIWGFSTENWDRPHTEVDYLMKLFAEVLNKYAEQAIKEQIRICHIGRKDRIGEVLKNKIQEIEEKTAQYTDTTLIIALDYGGRDEIIRAVNKLKQEESLKEVNEETVSSYMDTTHFPDPDLIIRTGGEMRLSGYLLWQSEYSELYFSTLYFPDFSPLELEKAIKEYSHRQRRFGK
jgi:undecaprenyl diphosphate synthase